MKKNIPIPSTAVLAPFCHRWKIRELALFGSALGDDFRPESDLDFLVTFSADAQWSLFDHVRMEAELAELAGRPVDLVTRQAVEDSTNAIRRQAILSSAETIYAA